MRQRFWLDFIYVKARADLKSSHARTILGVLWTVIPSLFLALILYVMVLILERRGTASWDYFLYLFAGVSVLSAAGSVLSTCAGSITGGASFILNYRVPPVTLVVSALLSQTLRFAPLLVVIPLIALVTIGIGPGSLFLAAASLVVFWTFLLGLSLFLATIQTYFRDVKLTLPMIMRALMYITPVLYVPSQISPALNDILQWNPMYWMVVGWNGQLTGLFEVSMSGWVQMILWALFGLGLGITTFVMSRNSLSSRLS